MRNSLLIALLCVHTSQPLLASSICEKNNFESLTADLSSRQQKIDSIIKTYEEGIPQMKDLAKKYGWTVNTSTLGWGLLASAPFIAVFGTAGAVVAGGRAIPVYAGSTNMGSFFGPLIEAGLGGVAGAGAGLVVGEIYTYRNAHYKYSTDLSATLTSLNNESNGIENVNIDFADNTCAIEGNELCDAGDIDIEDADLAIEEVEASFIEQRAQIGLIKKNALERERETGRIDSKWEKHKDMEIRIAAFSIELESYKDQSEFYKMVLDGVESFCSEK